MRLWVVTQEGIYRHGIMGIYDSYDTAVQRALDCARDDSDSYHQYFIGTAQLNSAISDIDDLGVYTCKTEDNWRSRNGMTYLSKEEVK